MSNDLFVIGITGGIGSGKSVVSRLLRLMGVPVYDCDREAKRLMCESVDIREALIKVAGAEVYDAAGRLNRAYLSSFIFALCSYNTFSFTHCLNSSPRCS